MKNGAGTTILTGANAYSGGTTVNAGILQGNTAGLQGNILNNASVVFDQTGEGTYAGTMSGTGALTKSGAGTVTLTGTNTYHRRHDRRRRPRQFSSDANFGTGTVIAKRRRPAVGGRRHADRSSRLVIAGRQWRHLRHQTVNSVTLDLGDQRSGQLVKSGSGS